jgi:hypothetical protein
MVFVAGLKISAEADSAVPLLPPAIRMRPSNIPVADKPCRGSDIFPAG